MKNQALFSSKDKSKKFKCRLLQILFGTLRVNILSAVHIFQYMTLTIYGVHDFCSYVPGLQFYTLTLQRISQLLERYERNTIKAHHLILAHLGNRFQ